MAADMVHTRGAHIPLAVGIPLPQLCKQDSERVWSSCVVVPVPSNKKACLAVPMPEQIPVVTMAAFGAPSHADAAKVKIIGVQSEQTIIDAAESLLLEILMQFSGWQRSHRSGQAPLRGQAHKQPGTIVTRGASGRHCCSCVVVFLPNQASSANMKVFMWNRRKPCHHIKCDHRLKRKNARVKL